MIYRLVKNGLTWDYSNHLADILKWTEQILKEEPDASVAIRPSTQTAWNRWRAS